MLDSADGVAVTSLLRFCFPLSIQHSQSWFRPHSFLSPHTKNNWGTEKPRNKLFCNDVIVLLSPVSQSCAALYLNRSQILHVYPYQTRERKTIREKKRNNINIWSSKLKNISVIHHCLQRKHYKFVFITFTCTVLLKLLGRATWTKHYRDGVELPEIARDDNYDFNFQVV